MRLNAWLARAGVASRRGADELIKAGRVTVNGAPGQLNTFVESTDDVRLDGEPIATGVLHCNEGVALFGGASTLPKARQQGAQRALFDARLRLALDRGCDLAMMGAHPGSVSQRNAERQGFRIAYTRTKWQLPALDTNGAE